MTRIQGVLGWMVVFLLLGGCQTPSPRLPAYLGPMGASAGKDDHVPASLPTFNHRVGMMVISDSSFPDAAPSLSPEMTAILENRLAKKMKESFGVDVTPVRVKQPWDPRERVGPFTELANAHHLDFLLLAILSSREVEGHTEIGAETMMNRMSGIEIDNTALAEVALLRGDSGAIALRAAGTGSSTMEQLAAPLGEDYPRNKHARDILRANAAEKALDQALVELQRQWSQALVKSSIKTAS